MNKKKFFIYSESDESSFVRGRIAGRKKMRGGPNSGSDSDDSLRH